MIVSPDGKLLSIPLDHVPVTSHGQKLVFSEKGNQYLTIDTNVLP
jgi:hypothetical protein